MDPAPRSRLTVALAIAAIVLVLVLLLVGAVLAPTTEEGTGTEASLAPTPSVAGGSVTTTTIDHAAHEAAGDETHAEHEVVAAVGDATVEHAGHAEHAGEVAGPAAHVEHTDHVVTTTPGTAHHDHGATTTTTVPVPVVTTTTTTVVETDEQVLLARTFAGLTRFADRSALVADGYAATGGGGSPYDVYVNGAYLDDGNELDPMHVEQVVLDATGAIVAGGYVTDGAVQYVWLVEQPCGQLASMEDVLAGC